LTVSPTADISSTVRPTTTLVPTTTWTPSTTLTITDTEVLNSVPPKNNRSCPRSSDIPKAQALAAKYGSSPEFVGGLFCKGFGFGEIDKAFSLFQQTGAPIEYILGLRSSGLGWGEIEALLRDAATTQLQEKNKPKPGANSNSSLLGGQVTNPSKNPGLRTKPKKKAVNQFCYPYPLPSWKGGLF
jgi:hypothetical protein